MAFERRVLTDHNGLNQTVNPNAFGQLINFFRIKLDPRLIWVGYQLGDFDRSARAVTLKFRHSLLVDRPLQRFAWGSLRAFGLFIAGLRRSEGGFIEALGRLGHAFHEIHRATPWSADALPVHLDKYTESIHLT